VATDVAARGLDLPDLAIVIHADLPQNKQVMVHRSGRTGRAGKKGVAILIVPDAARRFAERLLHSAHLEATWKMPPTSDDIRIRDQDQLVLDIRALTEDPTDDDRQVAKTLLLDRSAEDLVAALVHQRRQARPAPEELTIPPSMRPRGREPDRAPPRPAQRTERREREQPVEVDRRRPPLRSAPREPMRSAPREEAPRRDQEAPRAASGPGVWFTVNVGRSKNADPKWIVPLLCRRGGINKSSIGKIQILARETRVEIASDVSERFAEAARKPDAKDRNIHIEPLDGAS
jgi:ATP-dependent RNA helicase DeaD